MSDPNRFRAESKHPDEYERDLNPDYQAGQNFGVGGPHPEKAPVNAYDIKAIVNRYPDWSVDDLKAIPVLLPGSRLEAGAVYLDLHDDPPREFKARGDEESAPDNWFVAKSECDYQMWNRLRGVTDPERTGDADD